VLQRNEQYNAAQTSFNEATYMIYILASMLKLFLISW